MATAAARKADSPSKSEFSPLMPTFEISPLAEFNSRNLAASMRAGTAVMKGAGLYWSHVGAFMSKRLQRDAEAARELVACRSGEDAARCQHEFVSTMINDYFNEMHELLSIGAELAKGVAEPIEERAEEAFHNMEARNAAKTAAE